MLNETKNTVYLALGSNIGDRFKYILSAIKKIHSTDGCRVISISLIYETLPMGGQNQGKYLNAVIKIETTLLLHALFSKLQEIEIELGRIKRERWGSREIDIDILFYNDLIYSDKVITVPHPELHKRDFVLRPLTDIEPEFFHPVLNKKICDICISDNEKYVIEKIPDKILIEKGHIVPLE
jgi:2-amino-4-hydroxy-6-hydroxymethyldihydropteridine diphosphokinase